MKSGDGRSGFLISGGSLLILLSGAFADDDFGLEDNFSGILGANRGGDAFQQSFRGHNAHLA